MESIEGFFAKKLGKHMMPSSGLNCQSPAAALPHWTDKETAKNPKGFLDAVRTLPNGDKLADALEPIYRTRYPSAFLPDVTDPPLVIRGSDSQPNSGIHLIGFDYLRATGSVSRLQELRNLLQHYFPGLVFQQSCGRYGYALGERSDLGVQLNYTPLNHEGGLNQGKVTFDLSGAALAALTRKNVLRLCADLAAMNFRPSRLDLKFRDYDRLITPYEIKELAQKSTDRGAEITGFKKANFVQTPTDIGRKSTDGTMYLGRRTSSRMIRVYDAAEKHSVDAVDWELELKDEKAKAAWDSILSLWQATNDVEETYKLMGSIITSSVDFVHRTDKNIGRCERYGFWERMCTGFETFKLAVQKPVQTIEKSKKWVKKSVVKTLATVVLNGLGVTVSEIKDKGIAKVLEKRKESIENYVYGLIRDVELTANHIDRLSAAENRAQAINSFSPLFQT